MYHGNMLTYTDMVTSYSRPQQRRTKTQWNSHNLKYNRRQTSLLDLGNSQRIMQLTNTGVSNQAEYLDQRHHQRKVI